MKVQSKEPSVTVQDDGQEIQEFKIVQQDPTLGLLIEQALLKQDQISKDEIVERYNLFIKIQDKEEVELEDKELNLISTLIASRYDTFTAGRMYELINNK